jgi:hypothetical protein
MFFWHDALDNFLNVLEFPSKKAGAMKREILLALEP